MSTDFSQGVFRAVQHVRPKGTPHALPTPAQPSLAVQEHANAPVACSCAGAVSVACASVPPGVPLCGTVVWCGSAALVGVGAQNLLLFVGSFGALSTLLYAAPRGRCISPRVICPCRLLPLGPFCASLTYTGQRPEPCRGRVAPAAGAAFELSPRANSSRERSSAARDRCLSVSIAPLEDCLPAPLSTPTRRRRAATTLSSPPTHADARATLSGR